MKEPEKHLSLPVIADFSYACLVKCATHFTKHHTEVFSSASHLPFDVLQGKRMPSFKSDIYSLAQLMVNLGRKLPSNTSLDKARMLKSAAIQIRACTPHTLPRLTEEFIS